MTFKNARLTSPAVFAALLLAVVTAGGCAKKKQPMTAQSSGSDPVALNSSVTDVGYGGGSQAFTPVPPAQPAGAYGNYGAYNQTPAAPAYEPVVTQTPAPVQYTAAPAAPAYGQTHTVRQGDTMYRIAIEKYGDGRKWTRIADANPGVSPTALKVGQRLNVP